MLVQQTKPRYRNGRLAVSSNWSGLWVTIPLPSRWQRDVLPIELSPPFFIYQDQFCGFEPLRQNFEDLLLS